LPAVEKQPSDGEKFGLLNAGRERGEEGDSVLTQNLRNEGPTWSDGLGRGVMGGVFSVPQDAGQIE